jgi:Mg2+/Co2+ transporter CorB
LKKKNRRIGQLVENIKDNIEETSPAILILNTIANTFGAVVTGGMASRVLGEEGLLPFYIIMTFCTLLFSEFYQKTLV